ncbi:MAG: endonuclease [Clostridia bacterium]|nr:endonuclease [Clostridia bacterium]
MPKTWYKVLITILLIIVAILFVGFAALVLSEYFPEERETLTIEGTPTKEIKVGDSLNIITYNLGYLSLDNTQDFFMDGGKGVRPKTASNVTKNLAAVKNFMQNQDADMYLFQEVDTNAKRSYNINQYEGLKEGFEGTTTFAYMFNSLYIPYPIFDTVGHVESGLVTLNKLETVEATRIALPSAYSWPKRAVMYKNCLVEHRIDIEETDNQLVVYNIHLDAYGKEEGKTEQLDKLMVVMQEEYAKGNYVIAGGDFNQTFPGVDTDKFPIINTENYVPNQLPEDYLPEGWKFAVDTDSPTTRLLNEEYSGNYENTQLYIVDGFVISPNLECQSVETIENNFSYSDHHPVKINIKLK